MDYIDARALLKSKFVDNVDHIYILLNFKFKIKDTTDEKMKDINFPIVNFPFI